MNLRCFKALGKSRKSTPGLTVVMAGSIGIVEPDWHRMRHGAARRMEIMEAERIFERMRDDHRRMLERVAALEALMAEEGAWKSGSRVEAELRDVLALMERQFATHMAAEDDVLFPSLLEALPEAKGSVEPLVTEHAELRDMLQRLRVTLAEADPSDRDEQIAVQVRDLIDLLRIHIRKEEAVVISVAERMLRPREVEALAARMSQPPRGASGGGPC
jgi:hemerythrin-like domain-containing protein